MKRMFFTVVLALTAVAAVAQSQPTSPANQNQAASQKVIKDPAEYNAYITALNTQDPGQKAAAMEAFIQQYPNSVVRIDALDQLLGAYTATSNQAKLEETARRMLADNPNNVRALAIETAIERAKGTPSSAASAGTFAQTGLQALSSWPKPEGMSDADFEKVKTQMAEIFNGAIGFAALQTQDYAKAREYYSKSFKSDPNNLQDVYQLAVALLETNPIDLSGFWYGAKAIGLAGGNAGALKTIAPYIKAKYKKYHGKIDDWDKFAAAVASQTEPPPPGEMAKLIPPALTPCDFAVQAVQQNKPEDLSFSDWEFVLSHANCSPANKDAADQVWQAIVNKQKTPEGAEAKLKLPSVLVISATKDTIQAAITEENRAARTADLTVSLEKPVLRPPAAGTMIDVVGSITKYAAEPFMFTMEQGTLPAAKPSTPSRRSVHHAANRKPA